ncbi:unnamed protein product [Effrenium voratum]|uniref:Uncharacterized protein n=1 Tax=Effrenium voratum TaxID=2562239 RepID=A0AA36N8J6_9DINO|nr:unnamed protein product [Effrenium voratum]
MSHEVVMRWQRQKFCFRGQGFEVEHFDVAEAESSSSGEDEEAVRARRLRRDREARLQRCETELGACLWIDTNRAALQVLEDRGSYRGLRVLELGAGAGACGIATALDGADATVSDVDALLPLLQRNLELNQLRPEAGDEAPDEEAREEEEATAKTKAKMRRAKAEKAAEKEPTESTAKGRRRRNAPSPRKKGSCQAVAIEWEKEALHPTLPEKAFDLIVVCDCLYENRDSWAALQALLARLLVPAESGAASSVVLASAELRRPFLEAFVAQLLEAGFTLLTRREDGGRLGEVSVAILSRYQPVGGPASNGFTQAQSAPIGEHGPNEETLATPEAAQDCIPVEEQEITLTVPAIAQPGMKLQYRTPDGQELRLTVPEGVPPGSVLTLTQDPATKQWKCMAEPADEPPDFPYPSQAPQAPVAYPAQPSTLPMAQAYPAQGPPQRAVNLSFVPPPVPAQSYAATQMDPARFNPPRQDPMVFGMPKTSCLSGTPTRRRQSAFWSGPPTRRCRRSWLDVLVRFSLRQC